MKTYRFTAAIKSGERGGAYVEFPHDVEQEFGTRGQVKIKATFDGEAYRGSLAPIGHGRHALGLTKAVRSEIGKDVGDVVKVEVVRDVEPRAVVLPDDLLNELSSNPAAAAGLERRSPG